jgi:hypothetical protein
MVVLEYERHPGHDGNYKSHEKDIDTGAQQLRLQSACSLRGGSKLP